MQQRTEIPSELVSLIYAAATDNSIWQSVCDELYKHTSVPVKMFGHSVRTYCIASMSQPRKDAV